MSRVMNDEPVGDFAVLAGLVAFERVCEDAALRTWLDVCRVEPLLAGALLEGVEAVRGDHDDDALAFGALDFRVDGRFFAPGLAVR